MDNLHDIAVRSWPYVRRLLSLAVEVYESGNWNFTCSSDDGECVTLTLFVDEADSWRFYERARPIIAEASEASLPIVLLVLSSEAGALPGVATKRLRPKATLDSLTSFITNGA